MNIAIYTNILTPYRKYFYDLLFDECKKNGDEFHVLVMSNTEPNRNWTYDELKTDYTVLLENKILTMGETYIHLNKNLKAVLEKIKPDILICAGGYLCPGIWKALKLKNKLKYKVYFWSESHLNEERDYTGLKVRLREIIRSKIYKKFDGFWYAGKLSKQLIDKYCEKDADMYFMPNLIEEDKYKMCSDVSDEQKKKIREEYNVSTNKCVMVCPARLSYVKGLLPFIKALENLAIKNDITLLVAGDGELRKEIEKELAKNKLDVRLLGFKDQKSIMDLYSIADIFLLPSLSDPNPLTCIEALWAGLPLFISEHCGNYPEVVKQGVNGYVFSYKELEAMNSELTQIVSSDITWRENAKKMSLEIAREKYDSRKVVRDAITYFRNIVK